MELLACGHIANAGTRRICPHLVGEAADDVGKVWLLRGIGLEYDLCCTACDDSGRPVELIDACEGCVDNADDRAVKVVGAPQILHRPENFDPALRFARLPMAATAIAAVDDVVDYHWNVPMCRLDGERIAVRGIGSDDLAMIDGVEIFSARTGGRLSRFAGPRGRLFVAGDRLCSSAEDGMRLWDPVTGEQTGHPPGFVPTHRHAAGHELVAVVGGRLARWRPWRASSSVAVG